MANVKKDKKSKARSKRSDRPVGSETKRLAVLSSAEAENPSSNTLLKAGPVAIDLTKDALKNGYRVRRKTKPEVQPPLNSEMLREAALKARISGDLAAAEKHERAARRLDIRGPLQFAKGARQSRVGR